MLHWVIAALIAAAGGAFGFFMARAGRYAFLLVVAGALVMLTIWAVAMGRAGQGWDGLAYALIVIIVTGPGLIGLLFGIGFGLHQRFFGGRETKYD